MFGDFSTRDNLLASERVNYGDVQMNLLTEADSHFSGRPAADSGISAAD